MAYEKEVTTSTDDELMGISSSEPTTESHEIVNNESLTIFEPSDFYNGARFHNYCWSQSINEIGMLSARCRTTILALQLIISFRIKYNAT